MKRILFVLGLILCIALVGANALAEEAAEPPAATPEATVAKAASLGVVEEQTFEMSAAREFAALELLEAKEGAACKVTCRSPSGNKEGGIVCPVGKMCQCSCAGGGPDCTCSSVTR